MATKKDFYELLGVARNASEEEIRKAWRKMAMQHHPDRNQGDKKAEQKFKDITAAWEVLKDPQKRAAYDRYGHQAFEQGAGPGPGASGNGFGFEFSGGEGFSDIFDAMFGDMTGRTRGQEAGRGHDLKYEMEISLEDAFRGTRLNVHIPRHVSCESCHGKGTEGGVEPAVCGTCHGRGKVRSQQGFFTIERGCSRCHGTGHLIDKPCRPCSGSGRLRREGHVSVQVPAGVEEGTRLRLSGEGDAGLRGNPPGDLYIFISLKPHPLFRREGNTVLCKVPVDFITAALGGKVEVPTIEGTTARITVPEGVQTGHQLRLRGKGMGAIRSTARGDMVIQIFVETPTGLSKKQKAMLEQWREAQEPSTHPRCDTFVQQVKEWWQSVTGRDDPSSSASA